MVWSLTPGSAVLMSGEAECGWCVAQDVLADALLLGAGVWAAAARPAKTA
ncbi:MAG TPA: hypothetical protein VMH35_25210 [Streptosporangiaceae bacterium]|nr:hypothetical protein [Streptosporangiaceae bacterium]